MVAAVLVMLVGMGCTTPPTPQYPTKPAVEEKAGARFCSELDSAGRDISNLQTVLAYGMGVLALGAATTGVILNATNDDGSEGKRIAGIGLTAAAIPLGYFALGHQGRAEAAGKLGQQANIGATKETDRDKFVLCATAKGAWVASKGDSAKLVEAMLEKGREDAAALKQELKEEKEQAADLQKELTETQAAEATPAVNNPPPTN